MIEIFWGDPITLTRTPDGHRIKITTIEQAQYWLRRKWPVADTARQQALGRLDAAAECMCSVGSARHAFLSAAETAGFKTQAQERPRRVS
ncbi:DUF982 domain-containing protein [Poseidonocella sp. HB161398]|uniref:DUF982 domain-containing protein n=1 Tax=Poseidonocella sp. HB161398 TaxID=2320855 RepID=UPI0011089EEB|nr:DUF982 domain-containing protein [Poseidonocella sp. HB161398]